jgi:hypothetical protein
VQTIGRAVNALSSRLDQFLGSQGQRPLYSVSQVKKSAKASGGASTAHKTLKYACLNCSNLGRLLTAEGIPENHKIQDCPAGQAPNDPDWATPCKKCSTEQVVVRHAAKWCPKNKTQSQTGR